MIIGILKEPDFDQRVALLPENVKTLKDLKTEVIVEKDAGLRSFYNDKSYEDFGAKIEKREKVLSDSDLIISINPLGKKEYDKLKSKQAILTAYAPLTNKDLVKQFTDLDITSFSMDMVPWLYVAPYPY